jgi:hypothetical protein
MDNNLTKVIIPPQNLLSVNVSDDINSDSSQYFVRYRIVSEDKSRKSAWSPIYTVLARTVSDMLTSSQQTASYKTVIQGSRVELSWEVPSILKFPKYDVYVQWQDEDNDPISTSGSTNYYQYLDTSSTKTLNIPIPSNLTATPRYVKIWIQVETSPKNRSNAAKLLETSDIPLEIRITGGSIA